MSLAARFVVVSVLCAAACGSNQSAVEDASLADTARAPDTATFDGSIDVATVDTRATDTDAPAVAFTDAADTALAIDSTDASGSDGACTGWTVLKRLSPVELSSLLATSDPVVIDVHVPYAGTLPGTDTSIPYTNVAAIEAYLHYDHCADVVLTCLSGHMSESAGNELVKRGYLHVRDLAGGMSAWQAAGYPLVADAGT